MDSETLIDCVWPLGTDGPETAGAGHELGAGGGEWDVPLVGADIVDVWSPQFLDQYPLCSGDEENPTAAQWSDDIETLNSTSSRGVLAVKDLNPLYATLKEWKDEVATDLLDSVLEGDGAFDPLEDIDLDEFFRDLNSNKPISSRLIPDLTSPPTSSDAANTARECLPSPAPSCDSSVSSSSSEAPALGLLTVTIGEGVVDASDGSYVTIDPRALQLAHFGLNGEDVAMEQEREEALDSPTLASKADTGRMESDSSFSFYASEGEGEEEEENKPFVSAQSPVHHFHSYAQKPSSSEAEGDGGGKRKGRKKRAAKNEASAELRKTKKKEQNKNAAQRYRLKKKMETGSVFEEEKEEERRNKELKKNVEALENEIRILKNLMAEVKGHKRGRQ